MDSVRRDGTHNSGVGSQCELVEVSTKIDESVIVESSFVHGKV